MRRYAWNRKELATSPERPGVYLVWGLLPEDLMYVGTAGNLRERLIAHLDIGDIGMIPGSATVEVIPNYFKRLKRERDIISRRKPRYNKTGT